MYNANRRVGNMKKTDKIGHRLLPRLYLSFIINVRSRFNPIKININNNIFYHYNNNSEVQY
jgi:hypothetical protein